MKRLIFLSIIGILFGGGMGYLLFYLSEPPKRLSEQEVWKRLPRIWKIKQPPRKDRKITKEQSKFLERLWRREAEFLSKLYQFYSKCLQERKGKIALEGMKKYLREAPTHRCRIHVITILNNLAKVIPFWEQSQEPPKEKKEKNGKIRSTQMEGNRSTR